MTRMPTPHDSASEAPPTLPFLVLERAAAIVGNPRVCVGSTALCGDVQSPRGNIFHGENSNLPQSQRRARDATIIYLSFRSGTFTDTSLGNPSIREESVFSARQFFHMSFPSAPCGFSGSGHRIKRDSMAPYFGCRSRDSCSSFPPTRRAAADSSRERWPSG